MFGVTHAPRGSRPRSRASEWLSARADTSTARQRVAHLPYEGGAQEDAVPI